MRRLTALGLVLTVIGLAGCSGAPADPTGPETPSPSVSVSASVTMLPLDRQCPGVTVPADAEQQTLTGPDGSLISTARWGSGSTTAIMLHQTDGNGMCGFFFYGDYLAKQGVRVLAVDLCGYGQSLCQLDLGSDAVAQVRFLAETARADGAKRVVLVGASMGGSLAVTAGKPVGAAAIVDLSGPADFDDSHIIADAPTVTMPALIGFGKVTDPNDLSVVRQQLKNMPTKQKRLVVFPEGHGYDLLRVEDSTKLTPFAGQVLDWIRG